MSNFLELSKANQAEGGSGTFLVRWRGRQQGPYSGELMDEKLSANEIGMLHEILHAGQWITIRDYIVEQEAILRRQSLARKEQQRRNKEEEERREREELEKNAREQEIRLQAAILAEEQKKNDLQRKEPDSGVSCPRCGSTQITGHKQGFDVGRAVVGDLILGPIGLLGGLIGGNQIKITCLKCGHVFNPGASW